MDPDTYLTPEDLAKVLKSNTRTLANWRTNGRGPRFVKVGAHVRYHREDVEAWLADRTVSSSTEGKALR